MYGIDAATPRRPSLAPPLGPLAIELDIPCSHCGYILRGLKTDALCPECAAPITPSILGDRLEHASPRYVRTLWLGAILAEIALTAQLICTVPTILILMVMGFSAVGPPPMWLQGFLWFILFVLPGLAGAAAIAGWWMLTAPDPARVGTPDDPKRRRWLRFVLWMEIACWMVLVGFGLLSVLSSIPPDVYIPFAVAAAFALPFAILAHVLLSSLYFRDMSPRLRVLFTDQVCLYQNIGAITSAALIVLCILAVSVQSESCAILCFLTTFITLIALALVHIAMLEIYRRAARDAMAVQRRLSPTPAH